MATVFGTEAIRHASQYWLERIPYTTTIGSLAPGATEPVFAVRGWNPGADPARMMARLDGIGLAPVPNVQVLVRADHDQQQYDAPTFPGNLDLLPVDGTAFTNLSLAVINRGTTTVTNLVLRYSITLWRDPIAAKLLYGQAPSAADTALLKAGFNLTPSQFVARGHVPLDIDSLIQTSYQNRILGVVTPYALQTTVSSTAVTTLPPVLAQPGQVLILRQVAMAARYEDGVTLTIDRDTDTDEVVLPALPGDLDHPIPLFLPATEQLAFHVSATTTPSAAVPLQFQVWRVSLSDILKIRMGLVTQTDLAASEGQSAAAQVISRVAAGVL